MHGLITLIQLLQIHQNKTNTKTPLLLSVHQETTMSHHVYSQIALLVVTVVLFHALHLIQYYLLNLRYSQDVQLPAAVAMEEEYIRQTVNVLL